MALDATAGGAAANSYVSVADATTLLAERLNADAWTTATTANKEAALIMATRLLDAMVDWYGTPTTTTQALAWPQTGQVDCFGRVVSTSSVPEVIKRATAEQALALLRDVSESADAAALDQYDEIKVGDTMVKRRQQAVVSARVLLPPDVRQMLRCYGTVAGDVMRPLVRV